jgi:hypothetical protein
VRLVQVHCRLPRLQHRHAIVPESDAPEAVLRESAGGCLQRAYEGSLDRIIAVDRAIGVIADEQRVAQRAEVL